MEGFNIKIITVNIQISDLKAIDQYVGTNKQFPSRSEWIRAATFDFLIHELEAAQDPQDAADHDYVQAHANTPAEKPKIDQSLFVQVPTGKIDEDGIYKTYRIVKK